MTVESNSPLHVIEGIGPARESQLNSIGLFYVFDLLRASSQQVHASLTAANLPIPLQGVLAWRAMAELCQVRGMSPQWAEAIQKAGVTGIPSLVTKSHAELRAVLDDAVASGIAPDAPDDATLYELLLDGMLLAHTGAVTGTLRDEGGEPIVGAQAKIGHQSMSTDERGRFRLVRLPLGTELRLILSHEDYATRVVDDPPVTVDDSQIAVAAYELSESSDPNTEFPAGVRLSEYSGDLLPPLSAHSMTTEARSEDELRDRDVLVVHRIYADGLHAQLSSKFLDYEDGTFYVLTFKVALAALPPENELKDHLRFRDGKLEPIRWNAARFKHLIALRRARRLAAGLPRPRTPMEYDQAMLQLGALTQIQD